MGSPTNVGRPHRARQISGEGVENGLASRVPGWLERVILPQTNELKREIKALDARAGGFEAKVKGEFKAVRSEMRRLDEKIDGFVKRMDVPKRVAVIEEEVRELESRN